MGLRFRKSLNLAPGLKLNLSKRGLSSLSVGKKGMTVNLGRKGRKTTVSAPGTGLSYDTYEPNGKSGGWVWTAVLVIIALGWAHGWNGHKRTAHPQSLSSRAQRRISLKP